MLMSGKNKTLNFISRACLGRATHVLSIVFILLIGQLFACGQRIYFQLLTTDGSTAYS